MNRNELEQKIEKILKDVFNTNYQKFALTEDGKIINYENATDVIGEPVLFVIYTYDELNNYLDYTGNKPLSDKYLNNFIRERTYGIVDEMKRYKMTIDDFKGQWRSIKSKFKTLHLKMYGRTMEIRCNRCSSYNNSISLYIDDELITEIAVNYIEFISGE